MTCLGGVVWPFLLPTVLVPMNQTHSLPFLNEIFHLVLMSQVFLMATPFLSALSPDSARLFDLPVCPGFFVFYLCVIYVLSGQGPPDVDNGHGGQSKKGQNAVVHGIVLGFQTSKFSHLTTMLCN